MKEHPIILSTENVKAILDDRKTQSRRVIKPNLEAKLCENKDIVRYCNTTHKDTYMFEVWHPANIKTPLPLMIRCPYGQVGDKLWVRETHMIVLPQGMGKPIYRADCDYKDTELAPIKPENVILKWRPSIHMPRWASRITLEITEVRVERVQEISLADIRKEGVEEYFPQTLAGDVYGWEPRRYFIELWDSLNAKRGYGWEANPWVWVIEFGSRGIRLK